ncbi:MAG: hypothetical protein AAFR54_08960 [Planctomycetota bacterium]
MLLTAPLVAPIAAVSAAAVPAAAAPPATALDEESGASPFEESEAPAEIARIFDLRALDAIVPSSAMQELEVQVQLFPLMRGTHAEQWPDRETFRDEDERTSSQLLGLFTDYGGSDVVRADFLEPGVILLVADAAVHEDFQALVDMATELATDLPELVVRVTDGDETLSEHALQLPHRARTRASSLQTETVLAGVHSEIAQKAAIGESIVTEAVSGFELTLQGEWSGSDVRLAYAMVRTERVEAEMAADAAMVITRSPESGRLDVDTRHVWNERYAVEGGTVAGETLLTRGRPLVLEVGGRRIEVALTNARRGGTLPRVVLEDYELVAPRSAALETGFLRLTGAFDSARMSTDRRASDVFFGDAVLSASIEIAPTAQFELVQELVDEAFAMPLGFADLFLVPGAVARGLDEQLRILTPPAGAPLRVEILGEDDGSGVREIHAAFDMVSGSASALCVGREELIVKNVAVEVAQASTSAEPVVDNHFSGATMALELQILGDGRMGYRAEGLLSFDEDADLEPMLDEWAGERTVVSARRAAVEQAGVLTSVDGAFTVELGGAKGGPGVGLRVRRID